MRRITLWVVGLRLVGLGLVLRLLPWICPSERGTPGRLVAFLVPTLRLLHRPTALLLLLIRRLARILRLRILPGVAAASAVLPRLRILSVRVLVRRLGRRGLLLV